MPANFVYRSTFAIFAPKKLMEEFGDWIYIIVIVVAGITSLIGSSRKKARSISEQNRQNQQPHSVDADTGDEGDFWGTLASEASEASQASGASGASPASETSHGNITVPPTFRAKPSYTSIHNYYTPVSDLLREGQSGVQSTELPSMDAIEEYAVLTVDDLPDNADEWRKAFLYNEIFSRKN